MTRSRPKLLLALAAMIVGVVATSGVSAAATAYAASARRPVAALNTVAVTIASTGQVLHLPADWNTLSITELAKYGLHPGIKPPTGYHFTDHSGTVALGQAGPVATSTAQHVVSTSAMRPDSSSGCSVLVCIALTGKGLTVNDWYTTTRRGNGPVECTYAIFWAPGNTVVFTGETLCGNNDFYDYLTDVVFNHNVQVCNTWAVFQGKPCETVHS